MDSGLTGRGTSNGDILVLDVKQEYDICDFDNGDNDDSKCKVDMEAQNSITQNSSLNILLDTTEVIMDNGLEGRDTPNTDILPLGIKQECDISDFHNGENDGFNCKMDIENFSLNISLDTTKVIMDGGLARGVTPNDDVLPMSIKEECDMCDSHSGEDDDFKCEIDNEIFSIDNEPGCCVSSDVGNTSDDKCHIDSKINQIQKITEQDCSHDQTCDLNDNKFINKNTMEGRVDIDGVTKFKCHLCDYDSVRKRNLKQHIDRTHLKLKKFKCHLCEHSSADKKMLQNHIDGVHFKLKSYKCHLCNYVSAAKRNLRGHIDGIHFKKFKCPLCEHTSVNNSSLQRHIDGMHLNLRKFKCLLCVYGSTTKGNLQRHIHERHLKKFKCHLCQYATVNTRILNSHITKIHRKLKKFKCYFCECSFGNKHDLQRHIDIMHLKLKEFKCYLCEHISENKLNLQIHIDGMHLELKKFKCHLCEYSSAFKNRLQLHIDGGHLKH